ncbi:MAG TPA: protein translocase subunit SecF [Thermotogota bacterium]|nr:protein translocase subunit SecF [Thermotogota bacterium]HRW91608.1 protein translocase subunit SecF [Thermotogota bacterium]
MKLKMIDFTGKRKIFLIISAVLLAVSILSILIRGFNMGVDFAGGTEIIFQSETDFSVAEIRERLTAIDPLYETARIIKMRPMTGQEIQTNRYSVTVAEFLADTEKTSLSEALEQLKLESFSTVSGFAANELRAKSWWIAILAVAIILVYITIRFQFVFGVGAVLALVHDAVITLGLYSLFGISFDVSVIAAVLTLLGYSLNDTIVVYDRIRENRKVFRNKSIEWTVNQSINQTLTRTINTSLTTFIVVCTLLLFGGVGLMPFAFGLTVGVIVGTYSSIYIASPILIGMIKGKK